MLGIRITRERFIELMAERTSVFELEQAPVQTYIMTLRDGSNVLAVGTNALDAHYILHTREAIVEAQRADVQESCVS